MGKLSDVANSYKGYTGLWEASNPAPIPHAPPELQCKWLDMCSSWHQLGMLQRHLVSRVVWVQVRCAGCVWLTSLASFTGHHTALVTHLGEVQEAFSSLLGDSGELTQELASRGLCRVYHLGDASAQESLLQSLMGTLQGASRSPAAVSHHWQQHPSSQATARMGAMLQHVAGLQLHMRVQGS